MMMMMMMCDDASMLLYAVDNMSLVCNMPLFLLEGFMLVINFMY